ncbi:hypothetical protein [Streptomyces sp. NPDC058629]|uniref:hypothetical protein n=1 Tax=Streptomyces sp. NPDC058629 TaxID=3346565 RepID=UPI0036577D86
MLLTGTVGWLASFQLTVDGRALRSTPAPAALARTGRRGAGGGGARPLLIWQSLYELDKLCPYFAAVWVVSIALFWYLALHCLESGIVRLPRGVLAVVRDTHQMLLGAWCAAIALLVHTRFWAATPRRPVKDVLRVS